MFPDLLVYVDARTRAGPKDFSSKPSKTPLLLSVSLEIPGHEDICAFSAPEHRPLRAACRLADSERAPRLHDGDLPARRDGSTWSRNSESARWSGGLTLAPRPCAEGLDKPLSLVSGYRGSAPTREPLRTPYSPALPKNRRRNSKLPCPLIECPPWKNSIPVFSSIPKLA